MYEMKFGFIPKKKVSYDGKNIFINKQKIKVKDIKCAYFRPYDFSKNEWGTVYFSESGEDYKLSTKKNYFNFTQKQTNDVLDFLSKINIAIIQKDNNLFFSDQKQKQKINILSCPNCESKNVEFVQNEKKGFSVGKAVGGAALTGGVGTLAGFAGKKGNDIWHCLDCGNLFETKKKK